MIIIRFFMGVIVTFLNIFFLSMMLIFIFTVFAFAVMK